MHGIAEALRGNGVYKSERHKLKGGKAAVTYSVVDAVDGEFKFRVDEGDGKKWSPIKSSEAIVQQGEHEVEVSSTAACIRVVLMVSGAGIGGLTSALIDNKKTA